MNWKYGELKPEMIIAASDAQLEMVTTIFKVDVATMKADADFAIRRPAFEGQKNQLDLFGAVIKIDNQPDKPAPFVLAIAKSLPKGIDWSQIGLKVVFYIDEVGDVILDSYATRIRRDEPAAATAAVTGNPTVSVNGTQVPIDWPYSVFASDVVKRGKAKGLAPAFDKATTPKAMARTLLAQVGAIQPRARLTDQAVKLLFDEHFPSVN